MKIRISLITLFFLFSASLSYAEKNIVRVAVIKDADDINLSIRGWYKILTLKTEDLLSSGKNLESAKIIPTDTGFKMDDVNLMIYGVKIIPKKDGTISINGRKFRGNVDIIRMENKKLLVVNHIDIEDYLKGVLYHEVSHFWPMEILKAQAIAARTFALYQKNNSKASDYDLTSDIFSQVYGGKTSEKYVTNKAVDLTKGKVVTFDGKIFPTYYHATCAGQTEDASNLWNIDIKPLKGVYCTFCKESPHFYWDAEVSLKEIEEKLSKNYAEIKDIKTISVDSKDNSGRIKNLKITSQLAFLLVPAKEFRLLIGPNILRSTNFSVEVANNRALFQGMGWGHGVGMCQWGAYGMAKIGIKAEDIIRFYYPQSKIVKLNSVKEFF